MLMRILAIEPTPNPNNMKLVLDTALPDGESLNIGRANRQGAPAYMQRLMDIPGVKSLYQVADFMAVERLPTADWQSLLQSVRNVIEGDETHGQTQPEGEIASGFGEVHVLIQTFRALPMQIKLVSGLEQVRVALPQRFADAATRAVGASKDLLTQRRWESRGTRYGELAEVGQAVVEEIDAAYDQERLERLVVAALQPGLWQAPELATLSPEEVSELLRAKDWRARYAAFDRLELTAAAMAVIERALADQHSSIRRLAVVYLGALNLPNSVPLLIQALSDQAAAVRRAAGDCLSDLGDPGAIPAMAAALSDPSKLVRWRAARYLYEVGDSSALPALRSVSEQDAFEVRLQAGLAIERIEGGKEAPEPVWRQMTRNLADR
jgi:hypothetical protein